MRIFRTLENTVNVGKISFLYVYIFSAKEVHICSQYSFHLTPCSYLYIPVASHKAGVSINRQTRLT